VANLLKDEKTMLKAKSAVEVLSEEEHLKMMKRFFAEVERLN
jgi:hypothetical protein